MRGYGQFCPVAKAAEIFAERWTPLVLRELFCGSHRFGELHRGVPLMSRTLLAQRLRELQDAGVLERRPGPAGRGAQYHLTPAGEEFRDVVLRLGEWGQRWAVARVDGEDLDPGLLMWDIHRRLNTDRLPGRRVVARFDFRGVPREHVSRNIFWLVLNGREVDLCLKDHGYEVDLVVSADLAALTRVWMGDLPLAEAQRLGLVTLAGPRELARQFPGWLGLSLFAPVARPPRPAVRQPRARASHDPPAR